MTPATTSIGPYHIDRLLAVGGQAKVYRATGARGPVALKVARGPEQRPALQREAKLLQRCAHPHLVRLDHAHPEGLWLATEALRGDDLVTWCQGRPIREIVGAALELLEPIRHLHAMGILHGDLKPANVLMVDWGHPKLLDLGDAVPVDSARRVRGTPGFAAPEVLVEGTLSAPAELYAFGATLYAGLTGRAPFHDADAASVVHLTTTSSPLPPSTFRVDVPSRLDRLVMNLLARNPLARPELPEVLRYLTRLHRSRPARPLVGMHRPRARLRQVVAEASEGQSRCVVLYGPEGSGRRTLADEATGQARAEGMRPLHKSSSREFLEALRHGLRPVKAVRAERQSTPELVRRTLASGRSGLLIVVGSRPMPELAALGAVHLTPDPLDRDAALHVAEWLGVPPALATGIWERTGGHPANLWLALRPHATRHADDPRAFGLSTAARKVLAALVDRHTAASVPQLAQATGMDETAVLDLCETLVEAGLAETDPGGRRFKAAADALDA